MKYKAEVTFHILSDDKELFDMLINKLKQEKQNQPIDDNEKVVMQFVGIREFN